MHDVVGGTFGSARLVTALLTLFGLVGLGLGAVGVYGVTAQAVSERKREIGIRIALGADAAGVASSTVLRGMIPVAFGVSAGLVASLAGGRVLEGLLFGVEARDLGTFVTAPSVLLLVALASLAVPAVIASRVDPVHSLREE
jgi:ABC-type antimicrobial peptide transport system permease subunit